MMIMKWMNFFRVISSSAQTVEESYMVLIKAGNFFNVPCIMGEEDVTILCDDMGVLAEKINEFWKD